MPTTPAALKFVGPTFLPEPGCIATTFRVGKKWESATPGSQYPGFLCAEPHLAECDPLLGCQPLGPIQIVAKWSGPLGLIPQAVLLLHHDPACRTPDGLANGLRTIYGPHVGLHTHVVVLYFRVPD